MYQVFRPFFKNYFDRVKQESEEGNNNNTNNNGEAPPFHLNINLEENLNLEILREEYEALMRAKNLPYRIILRDQRDAVTEVEYNEESFQQNYQLQKGLTTVPLELVLADYLRPEYMRFNRCQDATFSNTGSNNSNSQ